VPSEGSSTNVRSARITALDALAREGVTPERLKQPEYEVLVGLAGLDLAADEAAATRRARALFHAMRYVAITAQQQAAQSKGLTAAELEVMVQIAAAGELLGFSDEDLLSKNLGANRYELHTRAEKKSKRPWGKRRVRASAWLAVSPRTLDRRRLDGGVWPAFLNALEQQLASGRFEEPEPGGDEGASAEEREPLRSVHRLTRRVECDAISRPLLELKNNLIDAVELVREPNTGATDLLLSAASMKVNASFLLFHAALYKLVLRHHGLVILADDEFGGRIADRIYGVYLRAPLNLIERDAWLHRVLSRSPENDILRAIQTAEAMPNIDVGEKVYDQWREFLISCQCEDDDHVSDNCPVHTLIRIANESYRTIESLRVRQR
jgi:hypothetical protein